MLTAQPFVTCIESWVNVREEKYFVAITSLGGSSSDQIGWAALIPASGSSATYGTTRKTNVQNRKVSCIEYGLVLDYIWSTTMTRLVEVCKPNRYEFVLIGTVWSVRESPIWELNVWCVVGRLWSVSCSIFHTVGAKKIFCSNSISCTQNIRAKRYVFS
jgi:hypothetical protein